MKRIFKKNEILNPNSKNKINCPFNNITKEYDLKTATMFNHLCSLGKSLSNKIPKTNKTNKYIFPSELIYSNTFYLYPISISEIVNVVKNCAMKTSIEVYRLI